MLYIKSFMKAGEDVIGILRLCFSNLEAVMLALLMVGIYVVHR
jgi:hypothetical protein